MRLRVVLAGAAVALLAVACGGVPADVAARVDGETIPMSRLSSIVSRQVAAAPQGAAAAPDPASGQRSVLSLLIQAELIEQAARQRGVEVTEEDIEGAIEQQASALGGRQQLDQRLREFGLSRQEARRVFFRVLALEERLRASLSGGQPSEAELRERYRQEQGTLAQVQLRHILVDSRGAAQQVRDRLEGGADFAELARQRSTDQRSASQGGSLGTLRVASLPQSIQGAIEGVEPGGIVGPVQTPAGFHVLQVVARNPDPTFEQVRDQLAQQLSQERQQSYEQFITDLFTGARVTVNPRIGRWSGASRQVEPPRALVDATRAPGGGAPPLPAGAPTVPPTATPAPTGAPGS